MLSRNNGYFENFSTRNRHFLQNFGRFGTAILVFPCALCHGSVLNLVKPVVFGENFVFDGNLGAEFGMLLGVKAQIGLHIDNSKNAEIGFGVFAKIKAVFGFKL